MGVGGHLSRFAGKRVVEFKKGTSHDPGDVIFRIRVDWDDRLDWVDKFSALLDLPDIEKTSGLVVGSWTKDDPSIGPEKIIAAIVASREKLPQLDALFLGDITSEENEVSWIWQDDVSPLLTAFPNLKILRVRGIGGLSFGGLNHAHLQHLAIECGGLPRSILQEVIDSHLPALEHLELWLGDSNYGFNFEVSDLQPLFEGKNFPKLTYLGLRNAEITDEIARAIADAPILDQLDTLDLSMGTLGDEGALALFDAPRIRKLKRLNLNNHYCSDEMVEKMENLPLDVVMAYREYAYDSGSRYVQVSE